MIKPDVIVSWPHHMDYPLFRYNMQRFKKYFGNIYVTFTQNTMPDPHYNRFLIKNVPEIQFITPLDAPGDWRDVSVNFILKNYSKASHVLFLEQDFLIRDRRFFEVVFTEFQYNFMYYQEGERIHPAFALVPREVIDKTSKDFSARPPLYDHFGLFFREVGELANGVNIENIGLHDFEDYHHMAGFTQNYNCIKEGQPLYRPEEFLSYNHYVQKVPVVQDPSFLELCQYIEKEYGSGDTKGYIKNFFSEEVIKL